MIDKTIYDIVADPMPGGVRAPCEGFAEAGESIERFGAMSDHPDTKDLPHSEQEWRQRLSPEQYHVLREAGTEPAFTGRYWNNHEKGEYVCAGCGEALFASGAKFDSGTGWPSFTEPERPEAVSEHADTSHGMRRVEARCARCGGHLGHIFPDGPGENGLRYCLNSAALDFKPDQ